MAFYVCQKVKVSVYDDSNAYNAIAYQQLQP